MCLKCDPGQFQNETGQQSCDLCPGGFFCPDAGTSRPTECVVKDDLAQHCPEGSLRADLCSIGHYCPNATSMLSCTPGEHLCPEGTVSQTICTEGYQCSVEVTCEDGLKLDVWADAPIDMTTGNITLDLTTLPHCEASALRTRIASAGLVELEWNPMQCAALEEAFASTSL